MKQVGNRAGRQTNEKIKGRPVICEKCGRNHVGETGGFFGYNGFVCRLIAFIRMVMKLFGK